ncbi:MAG: beta-N-acetylhexosaminidase [Ferruginibacter sp.]
MKKYIVLALLFISYNGLAQLNIVPMPAEIKLGEGSFIISPSTKIVVLGGNLNKIAGLLNEYLNTTAGFSLKVQSTPASTNAIVLNFEKLDHPIAGAYTMNIGSKEVYIAGDNEAGVFNGLQTLLQLIPATKTNEISIPQLTLKDYPRFAYRGMHLDVARHFFPVSFIKKYIDYLAAYKFNTFHWHLTDDQGWRIEIKKYPKLTEVGGFRNGTIIGRYPGTGNDSIHYGGFYTQEQIKEVVKYAADRYIDVIPEIELPGHASAAIAAYPQLSCFPNEATKILESTPWAGRRNGKQVQQTWGIFEDVFCPSEYTFNFLENVMDEVLQLFPSKYIHIGGDECPKEAWKKSAFCQKLIKDKNLKDEHGLQSYFIQHMEKYINGKGRKIIGWDEILEGGLAPNATVMSWRGEEGGIEAAKQNHDVVMTPGGWVYFDHSQSSSDDSVTIGGYTSLEKVYGYEPVPAKLSADKAIYILGAQANVWTEYIKNEKKVAYMIFPRLAALAEVLWSPKEQRDWKNFEKRLPAIFERYDQQKTNYSKAYYELKATVLPTADFNGLLWKLESKYDFPIQMNFNNGDSVWTYNNATLITPSIFVANATGKGTTLSQTFSFNKATGKKITLATEPNKSNPGDGAFTLVNGVQNEKALSRSREFIGFAGKDLEAVIDLLKSQPINQITLHTFEQTGSWIYRPAWVSFYSSENGTDFILLEKVDSVNEKRHLHYSSNTKTKARYIKVIAKNYGIIPTGQPGSGNPAWLFADEVEVK